VIDVHNKVDAAPVGRGRAAAGPAADAEPHTTPGTAGDDDARALAEPAARELRLSAVTGQGLPTLRRALLELGGWTAAPDGVFIARTRHLEALSRCAAHLDSAAANARATSPALDLYAEDLRLAHRALGEITGAMTADELLGEIFGRFCIGK
jgi:tRNA modification GTPase